MDNKLLDATYGTMSISNKAKELHYMIMRG